MMRWCYKAFRELTEKDRFGHFKKPELLKHWADVFNRELYLAHGLKTTSCFNCHKITSTEFPIKKRKFFKEGEGRNYCHKCEEEIIAWIKKAIVYE